MSAEATSDRLSVPNSPEPAPRDLEDIAAHVATASADLVRRRSGAAVVFETKSTATDVVTETDLEVEALIRSELARATPGASVLGEEDGSVPGMTRIGWVVDPIDGTVNFLYDLPVMSVSIAATVDGRIVAGAVADVIRGEVFSGSLGNGVTKNGHAVHPTPTAHLADSLVATGFSYDAERRRAEGAIVARVLPLARDIRCFGSAALHLCWVACGRLDAFYEHGLNEWDVAAGAFLVREAGGRVRTDTDGNGLTLAAGTPPLFEALGSVIAG